MPLESPPAVPPEVISVKPRRPTVSASDTSATVDITFAHRNRNSPTDQPPTNLSPPQPSGPSPPQRSASPFLRQIWSQVMADTPMSPDVYDTALDNHGVDYVITYSFPSKADTTEVETQFARLITALDAVGMRAEVRRGRNGSLLVFTRIRSSRKLISAVYKSRVRDWLHGVRPAAPDRETQRSLDSEPLTEAERLRIAHALLTQPVADGGAGITPGKGEWTHVQSIFPLHDINFNRSILREWSTKWTLGEEELRVLRDRFGERVAFYFAFLQSYFSFLVFAAAIGVGSYFLLPEFSVVFSIANCLWSVVFVEYWKRKEVDLAVQWNVRNVSQLQSKRARFKPEAEVEDPVTGEIVKTFPVWKRLVRQALQVPFALGASGVLSALYACVFAIEIFISEVYNGPFKSIMVFIPTVLLSVLVPTMTGFLSRIAATLTDWENYENESSHEAAMTQKVFVFNVITSYVPLFLTAFIYIPFGNVIVPHLDVLGLLTPAPAGDEKLDPITTTAVVPAFQVNPGRLQKQVFYFTVTAQAVNLAMETIVPVLKRRALRKAKEFNDQRQGKQKEYIPDLPQEKPFLDRVRNEAELDTYVVTDDLREMCMQFGYLCLFSPVWPLAAVSFLVNNWIELRSDMAKICLEMRRPVPHRADSIGPWLDNLGFLTWLGSVTTAALVYLFSTPVAGQELPSAMTLSGILVSIFLSEHVYFITRYVVRVALSKLDSPGLLKERRERFLVRRRFLQESIGVDENSDVQDDGIGSCVEKEGAESEFWIRQRGTHGAVDAGLEIIRSGKNVKKDQ